MNGLASNPRYAALAAGLRPDCGPAFFVPRLGTKSRLALTQYEAGPDARYVLVSRAGSNGDQRLRETLDFGREVRGVELIYDLTAETMQGKARPFDCELPAAGSRLYSILPVQLEAIVATILARDGAPHLSVEFHDAQGQRLRAALPFQLQVKSASGRREPERDLCTDRDGKFASDKNLLADLPPDAQLVIRSLLTGREQKAHCAH